MNEPKITRRELINECDEPPEMKDAMRIMEQAASQMIHEKRWSHPYAHIIHHVREMVERGEKPPAVRPVFAKLVDRSFEDEIRSVGKKTD